MPNRLDVNEPTSLVRGGEPFRRGNNPLDFSFLDDIEQRENSALGALDLRASFQRRRGAKGISQSFGNLGSRLPGVKSKILADMLAGSIGDTADRRLNVTLGQTRRRAGFKFSDLTNSKNFMQRLASQRFGADLQLALNNASRPGFFESLLKLGGKVGQAYAASQGAPKPASQEGPK